jgi:hypothetical protein
MLGEQTPLDVVRHELWRNTDRNPVDAGSVMDMIQEAVDTLGDEAEAFTQRLGDVLDPYSSGRLGATTASHIETMGDLATDRAATRVERWGALSLLGVLAITHNPTIDDETLIADSSVRRLHLAGYIARGALLRVQYSQADEVYRNVAEALLTHDSVPPEDVATEFAILGFNGERQLAQPLGEKDAPGSNPNAVIDVRGSTMSEPYEYSLPKSDAITGKLRAMDWLNDQTTLESDARDVFHDGSKVATLIDLTTRHTTLQELRDEAVLDPKQGDQFWSQVGMTITKYAITGRSNPLHGRKVPTFYMKNMATANGNIMRAYFSPLGNDADGVPIIALIGACRTKGNEVRVHRILCRSSKHRMSDV